MTRTREGTSFAEAVGMNRLEPASTSHAVAQKAQRRLDNAPASVNTTPRNEPLPRELPRDADEPLDNPYENLPFTD
jgi:hypothetical protein